MNRHFAQACLDMWWVKAFTARCEAGSDVFVICDDLTVDEPLTDKERKALLSYYDKDLRAPPMRESNL